tara:strand:+ start:713 stop:1504 length:792 start_codon:yes stop_codon:yes gene_type:complete
MANTNKVAKADTTAMAEFDASMFESDAGQGMENMGQEDLALPFLKILSGLDPILDEREDARKGDLYNTVTGQVYKGKDGIRVIPCAYQRRFIRWAPRGTGSGAPVAIYTPEDARPETERGKDDNRDYVQDGSGDYLDETHQHFVIVLNADGSAETALIAMKSTQLKKSRKWNSMMASRQMMGKNGPFSPPRFSHIYHLKTLQEENSKGSWHGWEMSVEGPIQDAGLYKRAKDFNESIQSGDVVVKHVDEEAGSRHNDDGDIPF